MRPADSCGGDADRPPVREHRKESRGVVHFRETDLRYGGQPKDGSKEPGGAREVPRHSVAGRRRDAEAKIRGSIPAPAGTPQPADAFRRASQHGAGHRRVECAEASACLGRADFPREALFARGRIFRKASPVFAHGVRVASQGSLSQRGASIAPHSRDRLGSRRGLGCAFHFGFSLVALFAAKGNGDGRTPPRRVATRAKIEEGRDHVKGFWPRFCFSHTFPQLTPFPSARRFCIQTLARAGIRRPKRPSFPIVFQSIPPCVKLMRFSAPRAQKVLKITHDVIDRKARAAAGPAAAP